MEAINVFKMAAIHPQGAPPNYVQSTVEAIDVHKMDALTADKAPTFAKLTVEAIDVFKMAAIQPQSVPPTFAKDMAEAADAITTAVRTALVTLPTCVKFTVVVPVAWFRVCT